MAQPNWKTELGIRKKAQPIDLETLEYVPKKQKTGLFLTDKTYSPDTLKKVERKRALQREATSKSQYVVLVYAQLNLLSGLLN